MIIIFGVVGSGKSEQARRMVEALKCPYVSTRQLLKEKNNQKWLQLMQTGKLVPDEDIIALLEPKLKEINAKENEFILDGAPRSVAQAEWLINKVKIGELKLTAVIHLKVSRETTVLRMLNRGREDDKEEIITERFRQYEEITLPVLDYMKSQGCQIYDVDGEWSADVVERQIWQMLKGKVEA